MNSTFRRAVLFLSAAAAGLMAVVALGAAPAATAATATAWWSSGPTCGGEAPARPDGSRYRCTFTDDFNGSSLNTGNWLAADTSFSGFHGGGNCYSDSSRMVRVSWGTLRLTSQQTRPFICKSPYGSFTTTYKASSVTSRGRFAQAFGRFEFRARFTNTTATGLHSALWLFPAAGSYGGWPNSGEIDVAEWFSRSHPYVFPSVHYKGTALSTMQERACQVSNAGTQYHRYAVEWLPDTMRFYYDGQLCHEQGWDADEPLSGSQPFDKPFNIVMSQAMGQGWNPVDSTTPKTGTLEVDWVRAWS